MRSFNIDDYNKVKEYEKDFGKAVKSRFCTGLTKDEIDTIAGVYRECLNRNVNKGCPSCILSMMISVGQLYFPFKEKMEQEQQDQKAEETETKPKRKYTKKTKDICQEEK